MQKDELLQMVYDHFRGGGQWPLVRDLQVRLRKLGNVRKLAAEIGVKFVVFEEFDEGRCFLTLDGLARCKGGSDDLDLLFAVLRYAAEQFIAKGPTPVTSEVLAVEFGLDSLAVRRLGPLLYRLGGALFSGGSWPPDGSRFECVPRVNIVFYESVHSLADYWETLARVEVGEREAAMIRQQPNPGLNQPDPTSIPAELPSIALRSQPLDAVLQRDLAELSVALSASAWKASVILAGSCLEAILLDLWYQHEDKARERWKGRWPQSVRAAELAEAAAADELITAHHKDLVSTIRRARNAVHPGEAAREEYPPSQELAEALVAILRLLAAEVARGATT